MNEIATDPDVTELIRAVIKGMTITALAVYAVFAFVLTTQMKIKRQTVESELGGFLTFVAYAHFILSIGLIILAFILL